MASSRSDSFSAPLRMLLHTLAYVSIRHIPAHEPHHRPRGLLRSQHTSAYVSIRQHTSHTYSRTAPSTAWPPSRFSRGPLSLPPHQTRAPPLQSVTPHPHPPRALQRRRRVTAVSLLLVPPLPPQAYVSICLHASAYDSIRLHTSAYVCRALPPASANTAYSSIRQHTSAYVSMRQHTSC